MLQFPVQEILLLSVSCAYCLQTLYKFLPEHCEITDINKSLIDVTQNRCFKLNREDLRLNMTFSPEVDILSDDVAQVRIKGYMFRSNEYREGPIEFMLGMCTAGRTTLYDIPNMLSDSNIKCPYLKKHRYWARNVSPNATNMPPFLPEGRWMIQIEYLYMMKYHLVTVKWFTGIEYLRDFNVKNRTLFKMG